MKQIILLILLILITTPVHAKKFKVKNCDTSSMADINWAVDFITQNIDEMLAQAPFIPSKYADKMKKKWPSSTLKCSTKKKCSGSVAGYHSWGNRINLCWDQIRDFNETRCEVVGLIMHEKAHAANIPIEKKHNDANAYSYVRNVDLVYRLDTVVQNYCMTKATGGTVTAPGSGGDVVESGAIGNLALGALCSTNTQCASRKCGNGVCVCDDNNDCGSNSRCVKRIGKNYCVPTGGLIGDFCKKNSDCGIGKCEKKSCVCKTDKHCKDSFGSTNYRCAKPGLGFGKNFCQATSVANGGACAKNSDCQSGKCKKDKCVKK